MALLHALQFITALYLAFMINVGRPIKSGLSLPPSVSFGFHSSFQYDYSENRVVVFPCICNFCSIILGL